MNPDNLEQDINRVMTQLGDTYLDLRRENYLESESKDVVRALVVDITSALLEAKQGFTIVELLRSNDWREKLAGIHCAISLKPILEEYILSDPSLISEAVPELVKQLPGELGKLLVPQPETPLYSIILRPVCLALSIWQSREPILGFLKIRPILPDNIDDYAGALSSVAILEDSPIPKYDQEIMEALKQNPSFDFPSFSDSCERFAHAFNFWNSLLRQSVPHS